MASTIEAATPAEIAAPLRRAEANIREAILNRDTAERSYWIRTASILRERLRHG